MCFQTIKKTTRFVGLASFLCAGVACASQAGTATTSKVDPAKDTTTTQNLPPVSSVTGPGELKFALDGSGLGGSAPWDALVQINECGDFNRAQGQIADATLSFHSGPMIGRNFGGVAWQEGKDINFEFDSTHEAQLLAALETIGEAPDSGTIAEIGDCSERGRDCVVLDIHRLRISVTRGDNIGMTSGQIGINSVTDEYVTQESYYNRGVSDEQPPNDERMNWHGQHIELLSNTCDEPDPAS